MPFFFAVHIKTLNLRQFSTNMCCVDKGVETLNLLGHSLQAWTVKSRIRQ